MAASFFSAVALGTLLMASFGAAKSATVPAESIQLKVSAGSEELDESVYSAIYGPFAQAFQLHRAPPYDGALEVTFSSKGHDWLGGGDSANPNSGGGRNSHWYTGDGPTAVGPPDPAMVKWQTSRMTVVLRGGDGKAWWSADYIYNGGLEFSGWVVRTPAQAAGLIARRLSAKFKADPNPVTGHGLADVDPPKASSGH